MFLVAAAQAIGSFLAAPAVATAATTAAAIAGTTATVSALSMKSGKLASPSMPSAPAAPKPEDSLLKAQTDAQGRTKARLANGGQTIYTSPTGASVSAGNVQMHTLLGV